MNHAQLNALTFSSMDKLFTTRSVPRAGAVWILPRSERALDYRYEFEGKSYMGAPGC
jgi:hypothetical protein